MKRARALFISAIPLAAGILLTIISLTFIIQMNNIEFNLRYFDFGNFLGFMIFGVLGIPTIFVGLDILCERNKDSDQHT